MLVRLRTVLGRPGVGVAVLWAVATLLVGAVVAHAPADAAAGHSEDAAPAITAAVSLETSGHHDDGPGRDLGCGIGQALCAIGVVVGVLLLRRLDAAPRRVTWLLRRIHVGARLALMRTAALCVPPEPHRMVRLQI